MGMTQRVVGRCRWGWGGRAGRQVGRLVGGRPGGWVDREHPHAHPCCGRTFPHCRVAVRRATRLPPHLQHVCQVDLVWAPRGMAAKPVSIGLGEGHVGGGRVGAQANQLGLELQADRGRGGGGSGAGLCVLPKGMRGYGVTAQHGANGAAPHSAARHAPE